MKQKKCADFKLLGNFPIPIAIGADAPVCAECIKTNDRWVHLRTCQSCGITLCCDSSPNKHATAHAAAENHPLIVSAEPGERWMYCYRHQLFSEY